MFPCLTKKKKGKKNQIARATDSTGVISACFLSQKKIFFFQSFQQILGQIDNRNSSKITAQGHTTWDIYNNGQRVNTEATRCAWIYGTMAPSHPAG